MQLRTALCGDATKCGTGARLHINSIASFEKYNEHRRVARFDWLYISNNLWILRIQNVIGFDIGTEGVLR
jgi:hypothetical protein